MEKFKFRGLIEHYYLRKKRITETKSKLVKNYSNYKTSCRWCKVGFLTFVGTVHAPTTLNDLDAQKTTRNLEKIHRIILKHRKVNIRDLAKCTNKSYGSVFKIIHEVLRIKTLCTRWVPLSLTLDQKRICVILTFQQNFAIFKSDTTVPTNNYRWKKKYISTHQNLCNSQNYVVFRVKLLRNVQSHFYQFYSSEQVI